MAPKPNRPTPHPRRPLSAGETALARRVFGDAIDYARVTVTEGKFIGFQPYGTAMAPDGHLYMHGCYKDDYSCEADHWQGHFIHEMTHVWQQQNGVLNPVTEAMRLSVKFGFNYNAAYDYKLEHGKDLLDYNMEQQASIVQDYFMLKICGMQGHRGHCQNICSDRAKITLLEKTLAKFLQNPSYAANEAKKNGGKPKPPAA
ncbi:MAG: Rhs element Vgr protein [Alphaproteobacteria bacterium]|nr:Rhs element Vgr protein [Alphaproteobacteria bacterium]